MNSVEQRKVIAKFAVVYFLRKTVFGKDKEEPKVDGKIL